MTGTPSPPGGRSRGYGLDEVDALRERLDASYTEAQEALDVTEGDVVAALAHIEQARGQASQTIANFAQEVLEDARSVVADGEVKSARVMLRGQPLFSTSLALAGAAGAAIVVLGALLSNCRVEVAVGKREDEAD